MPDIKKGDTEFSERQSVTQLATKIFKSILRAMTISRFVLWAIRCSTYGTHWHLGPIMLSSDKRILGYQRLDVFVFFIDDLQFVRDFSNQSRFKLQQSIKPYWESKILIPQLTSANTIMQDILRKLHLSRNLNAIPFTSRNPSIWYVRIVNARSNWLGWST